MKIVITILATFILTLCLTVCTLGLIYANDGFTKTVITYVNVYEYGDGKYILPGLTFTITNDQTLNTHSYMYQTFRFPWQDGFEIIFKNYLRFKTASNKSDSDRMQFALDHVEDLGNIEILSQDTYDIPDKIQGLLDCE
jgi:hypothetical protein